MLGYLSKSISQLGDPALRRIALIGVSGSALIFSVLCLLVWWGLSTYVLPSNLSLWGWVEDILGFVTKFFIGISLVFVSTVMFPGVATILISLFLEGVVHAVEAKHYPDKLQPRKRPAYEEVWSSIKFSVLVIGLNFLCFPLYLILMFVPPINLILYYALNGYLISREYFELVAFRQINPESARIVRHKNRGKLLLAGILITFLLTIPIINFFAPIIAVSFMVHFYHGLQIRQETSVAV